MITVSCERFDGPLDLLLALARRNQYPLDRLPIAQITHQYSDYLKDAQEADVELGGEFIETASWLVLLKSRSILPRAADTEPPPERELERVLLDHETLRATAGLLRSRMEAAGLGPAEPERGTLPRPDALQAAVTAPPTVQDVVEAARRAFAAAEAHARAAAELAAPETLTVEAAMEHLTRHLSAMEPGRAASTAAWLEEQAEPEARIALFLALLELARLNYALLTQPQPFGAIWVKRLAS